MPGFFCFIQKRKHPNGALSLHYKVYDYLFSFTVCRVRLVEAEAPVPVVPADDPMDVVPVVVRSL